jgi:hypothetical protein
VSLIFFSFFFSLFSCSKVVINPKTSASRREEVNSSALGETATFSSFSSSSSSEQKKKPHQLVSVVHLENEDVSSVRAAKKKSGLIKSIPGEKASLGA